MDYYKCIVEIKKEDVSSEMIYFNTIQNEFYKNVGNEEKFKRYDKLISEFNTLINPRLEKHHFSNTDNKENSNNSIFNSFNMDTFYESFVLEDFSKNIICKIKDINWKETNLSVKNIKNIQGKIFSELEKNNEQINSYGNFLLTIENKLIDISKIDIEDFYVKIISKLNPENYLVFIEIKVNNPTF